MTDNNLGTIPEKYFDVYDAISPSKLAGSLKDKVVFVTGAGRGIGKAIALAFAEAGAHVALLSRTQSELEAVANDIRSQFDRKALVCKADASDESAVADAFAEVEAELGKIDVVVPNAAVNLFRPYVHTPFEDWWRIMEINVKGPMFLTHLAMKSMRERNKGAIIVISSRAALLSLPGPSAYCTSKTALLRAIACLQLELDAEFDGKSGVHMYALHPGGVKTDMTVSSVHPDMEKMKPGSCDRIKNNFASFRHTPELCAWTCVYLATGQGIEMRGRYIDVENDIDTVVKQVETVKEGKMYDLTVKELGVK